MCAADATTQPDLAVSKRMLARARVGERVPITIIVRNVGQGIAEQVLLHETPPHGGRIVAVSDQGSLQHDGTAVWDLGNLAPGGTRTVHATMLVTRTWLLGDTAVAHALNADPALDHAVVAAVRVRAMGIRGLPRSPADLEGRPQEPCLGEESARGGALAAAER